MIAFVFPGQGRRRSAWAGRWPTPSREPRDLRRGRRGARLPAQPAVLRGARDELTLTENTQPAILDRQRRGAARARGARLAAGLRRRAQPGRVLGARRRGHLRVRRRGADGRQPRPLHAGGGAGRHRRDGGDPRPRRRRGRRRVRRGGHGDVVSPANLNAPGQVVIAGHDGGRGARRRARPRRLAPSVSSRWR